MFDGPVLAGCVHGLENEQQGMAAGGVEQVLVLAQILDMVGQEFLVIVIGFIEGLDLGG